MTVTSDDATAETLGMPWVEGLGDLSPGERLRGWFRRHALSLSIATLLLLFTLIFFWPRIVITVREGQEGVLWRRFSGTDIDTVFLEGTHLIFPWDRMTVYEVRLQRADYVVAVLSTDGLEIKVDVSIRYRPSAKTVPQLHQTVGPEYLERIIIPEVVTAVREIMGKYRPEQLYTLRTDEMQDQIIARAAVQVRDRFVIIDDVLIRRIELPDSVQQAIQRKLSQEQEALEYAFRIQKEEQERTRKDIEAQGIELFQRRVAGTISPDLLRWKGIEATLELAKSNNAKVVVIGNGRDGLPLILNTADAAGLAQNLAVAPEKTAAPVPGGSSADAAGTLAKNAAAAGATKTP